MTDSDTVLGFISINPLAPELFF